MTNGSEVGGLLRSAEMLICASMSETAVLKQEFINEEDYLAGEEMTEIAHEYVEGRVFAMAVPTDTHGEISGNIYAPLH